MKVWMSLPLLWFLSCTSGDEECGGTFQKRNGIIRTPNFPKKFRVPVRCRWVINATDYNGEDSSIVVYFTQLFVTSGLTFTEFETYEVDLTQGRSIHEVTEQNVTIVQWLLTRKNYLVIDFVLDQLEGNHLRAMDNLLDVYGFNLTYEINTKPSLTACSVTACSFSGHCYASYNFQDYWCSCFPGFSDIDCGHGPLCESKKYACENEGMCRHAGDKLAICSCPYGFIGDRCEVSLSECDGESFCTEECLENSLPEPCSCGNRVDFVPDLEDHVRYEATVQLTDVEVVNSCLNNSLHCQWIPQLEQQIMDFLYSSNVSMVEDLKVVNITLGAEVSFTFIGGKYESANIQESLETIIYEGYIDDIGLNTSYLLFKQEPALYLKSVDINQVGYVMNEGTEFILSCVAQGSPHMVFRWFKDGVFVNVSKSERNMWTTLLPSYSTDQYTALLGIDHAEVLDQGRYTCQITDHGYQQCRTIVLEVFKAPQLKIYPLSLTVDKDANITIQCMSPDDLINSYSWSNNNMPIKPSLKHEYWEKLFPMGSMLTVNGIQKSTVYTCHLGLLSRSVHVEVTNHSIVPWCPAEEQNNVRWRETVPGVTAVLDCPLHYSGNASRYCILTDKKQARWLASDYSKCVSENLAAVINGFRKVTFGYGNASTAETLTDLLKSLGGHNVLYPGEGEPYLSFLHDVIVYLEEQKAWFEVLDSTALFYRIIDILLQQQNAIIHYEKMKELQELVNRWGLMWGNQSQKDITHLLFDTMVVDLFMYNNSLIQDGVEEALPHSMFHYPSWYSPRLRLYLVTDQIEVNDTVSIAIVMYNNLSHFNLRKSPEVVQNLTGVSYEMAFNIMSIVASNGINVKSEIEYEWTKKKGKELRCGISMDAGTTWNLTICQTSQLFYNVTLCSCPSVGTYTVFMVKEIVKPGQSGDDNFSGIVLVGCICCLIQSLLTLMFLTFHWLHVPKCYILFLKLQCCSTVSIIMVLFLYSVCTSGEQNINLYKSTCLQAFTLVAVSSQLCKLLLVYIEVMYIPKFKHLKPIMIAAVTGTPILIVLCTNLVKSDEQIESKSGLLMPNVMAFCTYIFCVVLLVALFVFVYLKVYKYLKILAKAKGMESKRAVKERIGLIKRAALVVSGITVMLVSSLLYQNWSNMVLELFFGLSCALLGCLLVLCYIVHSETVLQIQGLHILRVDNTDLGYSSESDNSPHAFCDKRETTGNGNRSSDIGLDTLPPRLQCSRSSGSAESTNATMKLVNGLALSGDSNDSGVQLEISDSRSVVPPSGYIATAPKTARSVTFHNDLVTGCDRARTYPKRSPKIKKMDSKVQIVPANKKRSLYSSYRQPEKRTVCVLIDRPRTDVLGTSRELKTETSLVH